MKKHATIVLLALLLAAFCAAAGEEAGQTEFYEEMPPYLRAVSRMETENAGRNATICRVYPQTANEAVNAEMQELIDSMSEALRGALPKGSWDDYPRLDVGAVFSRTGTSWMSFLTIAEVTADQALLNMTFDSRVYDIETGERIALTDVFDADSGAWAVLSAAVDAQLRAYFPDMEPDEARLAQLTAEDGLKSAAFQLGAARLTLTYRADEIYAGKQTLMHVHLYYDQIRPLMTERARAQTDNSRFRMIALTYDDGGARANTRKVMEELRRHGAQATFFIVGRQIRRNHDIHMRQQNAGYSIQSHTYTHTYPSDLTTEQAEEEKLMFIRELGGLIGVTPSMMRAPGGEEEFYLRRSFGYPLMHWSLAGGDSGGTNANRVANHVIYSAKDGDVVLLHDLTGFCFQYTRKILEALGSQGYLFVTVEELFADAGVPLERDVVYYSPYRSDAPEQQNEE